MGTDRQIESSSTVGALGCEYEGLVIVGTMVDRIGAKETTQAVVQSVHVVRGLKRAEQGIEKRNVRDLGIEAKRETFEAIGEQRYFGVMGGRGDELDLFVVLVAGEEIRGVCV